MPSSASEAWKRSDVEGAFAAREGAQEELRGEVEEAGGGGVSGEAAAVAAGARQRERRGGVDIARTRILRARILFSGQPVPLSCQRAVRESCILFSASGKNFDLPPVAPRAQWAQRARRP